MGRFTVRASKAFVMMAVAMTLAAAPLGALLAKTRDHEGRIGMIVTGAFCLVGVGGVLSYCLGSATRVDERGIRTYWFGISRPRRSCPWSDVRGVVVLPSQFGRQAKAVKVACADGRVFELRAPVATGPSVIRSPGRQFDKDAQAIIDYCHRIVPGSEGVTPAEVAQMARDYARSHRKSHSKQPQI